MISYTQIAKKPQEWAVEHEGRTGKVKKSGSSVRGIRWYLFVPDQLPGIPFRSRRAAFRYFEDGTKFSPRPVYNRSGRNKGARIR